MRAAEGLRVLRIRCHVAELPAQRIPLVRAAEPGPDPEHAAPVLREGEHVTIGEAAGVLGIRAVVREGPVGGIEEIEAVGGPDPETPLGILEQRSHLVVRQARRDLRPGAGSARSLLPASSRLRPPVEVPTQIAPRSSSMMARTFASLRLDADAASGTKCTKASVPGSSRSRPPSVPTQSRPARSTWSA